MTEPQTTPAPCPDPLTQVVTVEMLATRLGIKAATIRQHLSAGTAADWLPRPSGRINGGAVWRLSDLEGIEDRRQGPGPRPRRSTAPASAPRTTVTTAVEDERDRSVSADAAGWWTAG